MSVCPKSAAAFLNSGQVEALRKLQADNLASQRKNFKRQALLFEDNAK